MDQVTDQPTTDNDRAGEPSSPSPWLWVVGVIAAIAIVALIVGDTSSRERYLLSRRAPEPTVTSQEIQALADAVPTVEEAADAAREQLSEVADDVRDDLDDLSEQLQAAVESRGNEAAAHLDAATAWLDETIADIDQAADNANSPAVENALQDLGGVLDRVQAQLVQASSNLEPRG